MPEAGVHWFQTYHNHYHDVLDLRSLILDACFLFTPHSFSEDIDHLQVPRDFTRLGTDGTKNIGNPSLSKEKNMHLANLTAKPLLPLRRHSRDLQWSYEHPRQLCLCNGTIVLGFYVIYHTD